MRLRNGSVSDDGVVTTAFPKHIHGDVVLRHPPLEGEKRMSFVRKVANMERPQQRVIESKERLSSRLLVFPL